MNIKAIKGSYGDFGRVPRGKVIMDVASDKAAKLIASGAYVEATAEDIKAIEQEKAATAVEAKKAAEKKA